MKLITSVVFAVAVLSASAIAQDKETMTDEELQQWKEAEQKRARDKCQPMTDVKRVGQANGSTDDKSCPPPAGSHPKGTVNAFEPFGGENKEEPTEEPIDNTKP